MFNSFCLNLVKKTNWYSIQLGKEHTYADDSEILYECGVQVRQH